MNRRPPRSAPFPCAPLSRSEGHTGSVVHAAFSSDGAHILTASHDNTARVWDAATGAPLANCEGHNAWTALAAYTPNAAPTRTASYDNTARVWDAATGAPLAT